MKPTVNSHPSLARKTTAVVALLLISHRQVQAQTNATGVQICPILSCDVKNTKLDDNTCFTLVG